MTIALIVNAILAAFVVVGIVGHHLWAIRLHHRELMQEGVVARRVPRSRRTPDLDRSRDRGTAFPRQQTA
jgi:hypothetical protein